MGIFFTNDEEKILSKVEELNTVVGIAKDALAYTSQNEKHLVEFYRRELNKIASKFDPNPTINMIKIKHGFKTDQEAVDFVIKKFQER